MVSAKIMSYEDRQTAQEKLIATQIKYICDSFEKAVNSSDEQLSALKPLILKGIKKMYTGVFMIIELKGSFIDEAVERAFFKLKDAHLLAEDSTFEIVFNSRHSNVVRVRFLKPVNKIRRS